MVSEGVFTLSVRLSPKGYGVSTMFVVSVDGSSHVCMYSFERFFCYYLRASAVGDCLF